MLEKIKETAQFLESRITTKPEVAIVLGSGLGGLVKHIDIEQEIPYREIPNFPVSNVAGHKATMIFGKLTKDNQQAWEFTAMGLPYDSESKMVAEIKQNI